jgi:hypothetical protein
MWEVGLPPLLWSFPPTTTFTSFSTPDYWAVLLLLPVAMFVYSSRGRWVFPCLLWSFPPSITLTAFPLLVAGCVPHSHWPGLFIYSAGKDSLSPIFSAQCAPLSFPCVFIVLIAYYSVSLISWVEVGLSRGLAPLAQGCLWEYHSTTKLTLSVSSQAIWAQATGGPRALLVSPFNVKCRCCVPAGGVEGSKFRPFSVVLPASCVSSVSPRFHYRRHAFCFLPLATILESPPEYTLLFYLLNCIIITTCFIFSGFPRVYDLYFELVLRLPLHYSILH